jgi:iron complex transport system substrate-binding protein
MKNTTIVILFTILLFGCDSQPIQPSQQYAETAELAISTAIQVTDFNDSIVRLEKPAQRIVALAPHVVENVFTAGAGAQLVGVVAYSDFPEEAKSLPIVGGYTKTNLEKILELQPDLVIAWESGNSDASVARIKELGFPVYVDQPDELIDVAKSIKDIGVLAGTKQIANVAAINYLEKLDRIRTRKLHQHPVTTFYQVWNSPLRTINGNHIISDAIELCGGINIYANESAIAPMVNIESILERDPEVILASGMSHARPEWLDDWGQWPSLSAVKSDNLYFVNPDHIQRHTVRIINGINTICQQFQEARNKRG